MRKDTETALIQFCFHMLRDASELEARLTFYLITYLGFCPEHWCFVFKDELINGHDYFDESGKRIYQIKGVGLTEKELIQAIREVNKRKLLLIKTKPEGTLIVKLNIKYLKNAVYNDSQLFEPNQTLS